jgi:hypothetical protein
MLPYEMRMMAKGKVRPQKNMYRMYDFVLDTFVCQSTEQLWDQIKIEKIRRDMKSNKNVPLFTAG